MSFFDRFRRKKQSTEPIQCEPSVLGMVEPTEPNRTSSIGSVRNDKQILLEVGRQSGLKEQKLDDIHQDVRFIRDKMALQAEINDMRAEIKEDMIRLVGVVDASKNLIIDKIEQANQTEPVRTEPNRTNEPKRNSSVGSTDLLTEKERDVLNVLIETGALTYSELAEKMNVPPLYAKNLVNRILKKTDILYKENVDNKNIVAVKQEYKQSPVE